jgi:beta-N-acetylhexosaminidase
LTKKNCLWVLNSLLVILLLSACRGGSGNVPHVDGPSTIMRSNPPAPLNAVFDRMTDEQRVGQLLMVGLSSSDADPGVLSDVISAHHVGNVILIGSGWASADFVRSATGRLQTMATRPATAGIRLYISGNQEGGQHGSFQAFYGPGFQDIPPALEQGQVAPTVLQSQAATWGKELSASGVNLDLAPVMDTVPLGTDAINQPIGVYQRELGHDPATVTAHGVAVIRGLGASISVAEKHFPGLGRIQGNTDFTGSDISDSEMVRQDPYLLPYKSGWEAGAQMVMVALARYPRLDTNNLAVFSQIVIEQVLRGDLGFGGVVISDDLGAAAAVASVSPGDRATRFLDAGGDIVLTVRPSDAKPMTGAVLARMRADSAFRARVYTSVRRVLRAKQAGGLLPPTGA